MILKGSSCIPAILLRVSNVALRAAQVRGRANTAAAVIVHVQMHFFLNLIF